MKTHYLLEVLLVLLAITLIAVCVPDAIQRSLALTSPEERMVPPGIALAPTEIEARVLELVNAQRQEAGLRPLLPSLDLTQVARTRSRDMAERGYFDHRDPVTHEMPAFQLLAARGLQGGGENLFLMQGLTEQAPQSAVSWWMNSRTHRVNVLRPDYRYAGVGVVLHASKTYITQIFLQSP